MPTVHTSANRVVHKAGSTQVLGMYKGKQLQWDLHKCWLWLNVRDCRESLGVSMLSFGDDTRARLLPDKAPSTFLALHCPHNSSRNMKKHFFFFFILKWTVKADRDEQPPQHCLEAWCSKLHPSKSHFAGANCLPLKRVVAQITRSFSLMVTTGQWELHTLLQCLVSKKMH